MEHKLKILPEYFKAVVEGNKTFEIRKNDRDYKVGDTLILKEWYIGHKNYIDDIEICSDFTGEQIVKEISYVLEGGQYGLGIDYCILGLKAKGIELKNIDLTGISLPEELYKRDEEYKEFADALFTYLWDTNEITKEHLKEEACDVIQVVLSVLNILDIEVEEITEYWNTKHLEKLKDRPRKEAL